MLTGHPKQHECGRIEEMSLPRCWTAIHRGSTPNRRCSMSSNIPLDLIGDVPKRCSKCGKEQPPSQFFPRGDAPHKLRSYCKTCHKAYKRDLYAKNPKHREMEYLGGVRRKYGLSQEEYQALGESEDWRCAVCRRDPKAAYADQTLNAQRLHVDHCHETGRVRGLLCGNCNRALGYIEGTPGGLDAFRAYIETRCEDTE